MKCENDRSPFVGAVVFHFFLDFPQKIPIFAAKISLFKVFIHQKST